MTKNEIRTFPLFHGGVKPVRQEELETQIDGQTAAATFRFYRPARMNRIEVPAIIHGRGRPAVPTHPLS